MQNLIRAITDTLYPHEKIIIQTDMNTGQEQATIIFNDIDDVPDDPVIFLPDAFSIENARLLLQDDKHAAFVKNNVVYLLFFANEKHPHCGDYTEKVLKQALPSAIQYAHDYREEIFKKAYTSAVSLRVREYQERLDDNESKIETKARELLELRRKIHTDRSALKALEGTRGQWNRKAEREFQHLRTLVPNLYKEINLEDGQLAAFTHPVSIFFEGHNYHLGSYKVIIDFESGNLTIDNLTDKLDEYDHPHIDHGVGCLGNISDGVIRLLGELELFGALQMIHTFLYSYNSGNAFINIEKWEPEYNEENRYEVCHVENRSYQCVECGDRDCPFYDDAFEDCFEDSTLDDCINCSYQCELGRNRIRRNQEP